MRPPFGRSRLCGASLRRCTASGTRVERHSAFSRGFARRILRLSPPPPSRRTEADAAGDHDRAVRGRRPGRRARPRDRAAAVRDPRPAGGGRERRRRRRHDRIEPASRARRPTATPFVLGSISTHTFNQTLFKAPLYNVVTDFTPVALVAETPLVLVTRKDLPAKNLKEFVAYAKSPGRQGDLRLGRRRLRQSPELHPARHGDRHEDHARALSRAAGRRCRTWSAGRSTSTATSSRARCRRSTASSSTRSRCCRASASSMLPDVPTVHEQGYPNFDA